MAGFEVITEVTLPVAIRNVPLGVLSLRQGTTSRPSQARLLEKRAAESDAELSRYFKFRRKME